MSSYVEQQIEAYREKGADFVGSLLRLSVHSDANCALPDYCEMFYDNDLLPDEWAPEVISDLKLYLTCMSELHRSSLKKFTYDPATLTFDPETHTGYNVKRMHLRKESDTPTSHKIIHLTSVREPVYDDNGKVIGHDIVDVQADTGIKIYLKRLEGTPQNDNTGKNKWSILLSSDEEDNYIDPRYSPFINTLLCNFELKKRRNYGTRELRDLTMNILKGKLGVDNVGHGTYFIPPSKMELARELKKELKALHPGLDLWVMGVPRWEDPSMNDAYNMTQLGLTDSLISELREFKDEIEALVDGDSDTRESTWSKKLQQLSEIKKRIREYESLKLFKDDFMSDLMGDIRSAIVENM